MMNSFVQKTLQTLFLYQEFYQTAGFVSIGFFSFALNISGRYPPQFGSPAGIRVNMDCHIRSVRSLLPVSEQFCFHLTDHSISSG